MPQGGKRRQGGIEGADNYVGASCLLHLFLAHHVLARPAASLASAPAPSPPAPVSAPPAHGPLHPGNRALHPHLGAHAKFPSAHEPAAPASVKHPPLPLRQAPVSLLGALRRCHQAECRTHTPASSNPVHYSGRKRVWPAASTKSRATPEQSATAHRFPAVHQPRNADSGWTRCRYRRRGVSWRQGPSDAQRRAASCRERRGEDLHPHH